MSPICVIKGCKRNRDDGVSMHKFPTDPQLRKKWVEAIKQKNFTPSNFSTICSKHFRDEDFDRSAFRVGLMRGAIPSIFERDDRIPPAIRKSTKPSATGVAAHSGTYRKGLYCCALKCHNGESTDAKTKGLSFHGFPVDEENRMRWIAAVRSQDPVTRRQWTPGPTASLCSEHFQPSDFVDDGGPLKPDSVPSIFEIGQLKMTKSKTAAIAEEDVEMKSEAFEENPSSPEREDLSIKQEPFDTAADEAAETNESYSAEQFSPTNQPDAGEYSYETEEDVGDQQRMETSQPSRLRSRQPETSYRQEPDHMYVTIGRTTVIKRQLVDARKKIKVLKQELFNANRRNKRCHRLIKLLLKSLGKTV